MSNQEIKIAYIKDRFSKTIGDDNFSCKENKTLLGCILSFKVKPSFLERKIIQPILEDVTFAYPDIITYIEDGVVYFQIPQKQRPIISIMNSIPQNGYSQNSINIPVGLSMSGFIFHLDFHKTPHLLVAGTTGSGKTNFLRVVMSMLMTHNTPFDIKIIPVDLKKCEFVFPKSSYWSNSLLNGVRYDSYGSEIGKKINVEPPITSAWEAINFLHSITDLIEDRLSIFEVWGRNGFFVHDIDTFKLHAQSTFPMPNMQRIFIIIDEFQELFTLDKTLYNSVAKIARLGRSAGIHLIMATQRPSVKILHGDIKANFPTRVAFRLPTSADSKTILGMSGAEKLLGNGDAIIQGEGFQERIQVYSCSSQDFESIVSSASSDFPLEDYDRYIESFQDFANFIYRENKILEKLDKRQ